MNIKYIYDEKTERSISSLKNAIVTIETELALYARNSIDARNEKELENRVIYLKNHPELVKMRALLDHIYSTQIPLQVIVEF